MEGRKRSSGLMIAATTETACYIILAHYYDHHYHHSAMINLYLPGQELHWVYVKGNRQCASIMSLPRPPSRGVSALTTPSFYECS